MLIHIAFKYLNLPCLFMFVMQDGNKPSRTIVYRIPYIWIIYKTYLCYVYVNIINLYSIYIYMFAVVKLRILLVQYKFYKTF